MKQATIMVKQDDGSFKEVGVFLRPNSTISADKNGELQSGQGQAAIPQGDHSHAEGLNTLATGIAAHAEGGGPDSGAGSSSGSGGGILDGTFDVSGCTEGFIAGIATMNGTYTKGAPAGASGSNPVWSNGAGGFIYHNGMGWILECGFGTPGMLTYYANAPGSDPNVVPSDGWSCMGPNPVFIAAGGSGSGSGGSSPAYGGLAAGDYSHAEGRETRADAEAGHAQGRFARARSTAENAHASGYFAEQGDAQAVDFVLMGSVTGGNLALTLGDGSGIILPSGYCLIARVLLAGVLSGAIVTDEETALHVDAAITNSWSSGLASPAVSVVTDGDGTRSVTLTASSLTEGVRYVARVRGIVIKG